MHTLHYAAEIIGSIVIVGMVLLHAQGFSQAVTSFSGNFNGLVKGLEGR